MYTLKLVTFNIRCDCKEDGINHFPLRKPMILNKILTESPDIIGFQELQPHMITWLKESLPQYTIVGCGRGSDYQDEHNAIAYKSEEYELFGLETFWLSDTSTMPGSRFEEQSICPRICTRVTLKHKASQKPFHYFNTHLDHENDFARIQGMRFILDKIKEINKGFPLPVILTGDFNASPDKEEIQIISQNSTLQDCTTEIPYTYHGYGNNEVFMKIDYIYTTTDVVCKDVQIWDDEVSGVYISDHYPVVADLVFEA